MSAGFRLALATEGHRGGSSIINTGPIVVRGDLEFVIRDATATAVVNDDMATAVVRDEQNESAVQDVLEVSVSEDSEQIDLGDTITITK